MSEKSNSACIALNRGTCRVCSKKIKDSHYTCDKGGHSYCYDCFSSKILLTFRFADIYKYGFKCCSEKQTTSYLCDSTFDYSRIFFHLNAADRKEAAQLAINVNASSRPSSAQKVSQSAYNTPRDREIDESTNSFGTNITQKIFSQEAEQVGSQLRNHHVAATHASIDSSKRDGDSSPIGSIKTNSKCDGDDELPRPLVVIDLTNSSGGNSNRSNNVTNGSSRAGSVGINELPRQGGDGGQNPSSNGSNGGNGSQGGGNQLGQKNPDSTLRDLIRRNLKVCCRKCDTCLDDTGTSLDVSNCISRCPTCPKQNHLYCSACLESINIGDVEHFKNHAGSSGKLQSNNKRHYNWLLIRAQLQLVEMENPEAFRRQCTILQDDFVEIGMWPYPFESVRSGVWASNIVKQGRTHGSEYEFMLQNEYIYQRQVDNKENYRNIRLELEKVGIRPRDSWDIARESWDKPKSSFAEAAKKNIDSGGGGNVVPGSRDVPFSVEGTRIQVSTHSQPKGVLLHASGPLSPTLSDHVQPSLPSQKQLEDFFYVNEDDRGKLLFIENFCLLDGNKDENSIQLEEGKNEFLCVSRFNAENSTFKVLVFEHPVNMNPSPTEMEWASKLMRVPNPSQVVIVRTTAVGGFIIQKFEDPHNAYKLPNSPYNPSSPSCIDDRLFKCKFSGCTKCFAKKHGIVTCKDSNYHISCIDHYCDTDKVTHKTVDMWRAADRFSNYVPCRICQVQRPHYKANTISYEDFTVLLTMYDSLLPDTQEIVRDVAERAAKAKAADDREVAEDAQRREEVRIAQEKEDIDRRAGGGGRNEGGPSKFAVDELVKLSPQKFGVIVGNPVGVIDSVMGDRYLVVWQNTRKCEWYDFDQLMRAQLRDDHPPMSDPKDQLNASESARDLKPLSDSNDSKISSQPKVDHIPTSQPDGNKPAVSDRTPVGGVGVLSKYHSQSKPFRSRPHEHDINARGKLSMLLADNLDNDKRDSFYESSINQEFIIIGVSADEFLMYMENPINLDPSHNEIAYANYYMSVPDPRHMLVAKREPDFGFTRISYNSDKGTSEKTVYPCCFSPDCPKYLPAKYSLLLCRSYHRCCFGHIFPLDNQNRALSVDPATISLYEQIIIKELNGWGTILNRWDLKNAQQKAIINTRALVGAKKVLQKAQMSNRHLDAREAEHYIKTVAEKITCGKCYHYTSPLDEMSLKDQLDMFLALRSSEQQDGPGESEGGPSEKKQGGGASGSGMAAGGGGAGYGYESIYDHTHARRPKWLQRERGVPYREARMVNEDVFIEVGYPEKSSTTTSLKLRQGMSCHDILEELARGTTRYDSSFKVFVKNKDGSLFFKELIMEAQYYDRMQDHFERTITRGQEFPLKDDNVGDFFANPCRNELVQLKDLFMTIHQLKEDDVILFYSTSIITVTPGITIQAAAVADRNNDAIVKCFKDLDEDYAGMRKIRGDGNCYYRAAMFGLIENLIRVRDFRSLYNINQKMREANGLKHLIPRITDPDFYDKCHLGKERQFAADMDDFVDRLDHTIDFMLGKTDNKENSWVIEKDFEHSVMQIDSIDRALVWSSRLLIADWLIKNKEKQSKSGMTIDELHQATFEQDTELYCNKKILTWGEHAESPFIELGALEENLNYSSVIVMIDRFGSSTFFQYHVAEERCSGQVHLLFRPGHYDLMYLPPNNAVVSPALSEDSKKTIQDLIAQNANHFSRGGRSSLASVRDFVCRTGDNAEITEENYRKYCYP